jgi:hypothetical protein
MIRATAANANDAVCDACQLIGGVTTEDDVPAARQLS